MFGIIKYIVDTKTFRYLIVFLLGAALGATGLHALLNTMWHDFLTVFGVHNVGKPGGHL